MGVGAQNAGGEGVEARRICGLENLCVGGGCLVDTWAKSANWAGVFYPVSGRRRVC